MAQRVKDLMVSLQWLGLLLWHGLNPWPRNFCITVGAARKKKKGAGVTRNGSLGWGGGIETQVSSRKTQKRRKKRHFWPGHRGEGSAGSAVGKGWAWVVGEEERGELRGQWTGRTPGLVASCPCSCSQQRLRPVCWP